MGAPKTTVLTWQQAVLELMVSCDGGVHVVAYSPTDHKRCAGQGRPTPTTPLKAIAWQIHAPRRLRPQWLRQYATPPNQISSPTQRPTLRWVFQLLAGMHRVRLTVQGHVHDLPEGLERLQIKILRLYGIMAAYSSIVLSMDGPLGGSRIETSAGKALLKIEEMLWIRGRGLTSKGS
jgi:hypothetical protein